TIGRELVYPLEVLVLDTYNNPVSNTGISFVMSGGGNGTLLTPQQIYTDDEGIAAARLKLGNTEGAYKVKAINNSLVGNGLEFVANGVANKFPLFQNLNKEVTATENQIISFTVNATDEDDLSVSYEAYNLPPGATFDASGSQRFNWTPNYLQAGEYEVNFVARDGQGGLDDESVKIIVTNSNRRPSIFSYQPMQDLLVGHRDIGETFHFSITVADQDTDDEIKYQWYYNDVLVATTQQYSFYVNDQKVDLGRHVVTVIASDGYDSVERSWELAIKTPVELATFSAEVIGRDGVLLSWSTNYEANNAGFNVLRSTAANGQFTKINEKIIPANEQKVYEFKDTKVRVGETYYYKLEDISLNGVRSEHETVKIHIEKPDKFELSQNFPNPFNPSTKIYYQLADPSFVKLTVYNLLGQEVITLVNDKKEAGYHTTMWNGLDKYGNQMASGIYYYRIVAGSFVQAKKMVLIK
ncbi:T9SS type A sorting domain-containing protein, partial [candidate division KSB1 bacterium]|nr:T9SS type A sorting domain-containing protein [candidate division KSB1 bacterium]